MTGRRSDQLSYAAIFCAVPTCDSGWRRGCLTGLEPATSRITTGGSDRLSYRHHAGLPLEEQVESTTMMTRRPRAPLLPSISRESDICLG